MTSDDTTTSLLVSQVRWEADGVVSVTLRDPHGAELAPWEPGAHLDITLPSGLVRQYSLCGDRTVTTEYTVAVLKEASGRGGSKEIHETGLVGRILTVRGPRNHFKLVDTDSYLLIAGGIGITPILSMARELDREGLEWRLLYGGRSLASMAFLQEIDGLSGKVDVVPQDSAGMLAIDAALDESPDSEIFVCGPSGLLEAVETSAAARGRRVHLERFSAASKAERDVPTTGSAFEVELRQRGVTLTVPSDRSILEVIRDVVPDTPSSCEEGFCGSCETRVLAGIPEHHDSILDEDERAANDTMFICVGRCLSEKLVLDI